ncbi:SLC37A3 [Mytilus edulis]|uniref:Sugar phosphate exchanger 3 n=1 Tax=Mytilus edulis TaxID=6550 RepID=A0A8S3QLN5_MYTED|nr:SLC37A3 [Mytilus edulis]
MKSETSQFTSHHVVVFLLTFFSYAFFHATRKTFSNVKTTISAEWTPSFHNSTVNKTQPDKIWNSHTMFDNPKDAEPFLGMLDGAFLISYAVGLYISGIIGDRLNMRLVLSFGMISSGLSVFIFGSLFEWIGYYNKYVYVVVWILNGLLQSTGWPTVVAVMGNWFGRSSRGFVLGLWSACASVGNIIGSLLASAVLDYGYDVSRCATVCSFGVAIFFGLVSTPKELGLPVPDEMITNQEVTIDANSVNTSENIESIESDSDDTESGRLLSRSSSRESGVVSRPKALGFIQALLLPGVILYALSYACLKFVNYSFFFWLPFYLHGAFGWKETVADDISIWYDVGGIIGGTIAGFISDRFRKRSLIVIPMLVLAIPALFIYSHSPNNKTINGVLMAVAGFFVGGVANLISAAISADLGRQGPVQGNTEALATVTGIVDGTGSAGAAIGQVLVPVIQQKFGWKSVFVVFMIMIALTIVCILPMFIKECKGAIANYSFSWYSGLTKKRTVMVDDEFDET